MITDQAHYGSTPPQTYSSPAGEGPQPRQTIVGIVW
jgi:hypothetical protein